MADIKIKTKDTAGTKVKTLENAGLVAQKAKEIAVKTKEDVGKTVSVDGDSPTDYAASRIQEDTHTVFDDAAYLFNQQGKKDAVKTKKNAEEIKYALQEVKARRSIRLAEQEIKTQAEATSIKTASETAAPAVQNLPKVNTTAIKQGTSQAVKSTTQTVKTTQSAEIVAAQKKSHIFNKLFRSKSQQSVKSGKGIVEFLKKAAVKVFNALKAAIKAVESLVSAIVAGGWIAVIVIIVIALVGALACSTNGIFFSGEDSGTGITIKSVVQELNDDFNSKVENEKAKYTYDILNMSGSQADWREVLAVYAVKTTTDETAPQEVATVDDSKKKIIEEIFWDMNSIASKTETKEETTVVETTDADGNKVEEEQKVTKTTLYITLTPKSADDMASEYGFTDKQKEYLADLLDDNKTQLWNSLVYGLGVLKGIDISSLNFTNETATEQQKKVVIVATNSAEYGIPASKGYCQAWVADVYQVSVGNRGHAASAIAAGRMWSVSKDWSQIQVGAAVYGYSSSQYGHVGIYIGGGMVAHNIGGVKIESLDSWVKNYKGVCWGWENGKNLSGNPKYNCVGELI